MNQEQHEANRSAVKTETDQQQAMRWLLGQVEDWLLEADPVVMRQLDAHLRERGGELRAHQLIQALGEVAAEQSVPGGQR